MQKCKSALEDPPIASLARETQIIELGHKAFEARDLREMEGLSLPALEKIFLADTSVFLDWRNVADNGLEIDDIHLPPDWSNAYSQLYYSSLRNHDPIFQWLAGGGFQQTFSATRLSNLVDRYEFEKGAFYNELLRKVDCGHILTIALHCGQGLIGNISLLRERKRQDFDKGDEHFARMTALCLSGSAHRLASHVPQGEPTIAVIFDADLTVHRVRVDKKWNGPTLRLDTPAHIQNLLNKAPRLAKFMRVANGSTAWQKRLPASVEETITLSDLRPVQVRLEAQRSPAQNLLLTMTISEIKTLMVSPQATLTSRELQIAQLAATGTSCSKIGSRLCISPWTVKNHLKAIYVKTGVNNRVGLSRLLD